MATYVVNASGSASMAYVISSDYLTARAGPASNTSALTAVSGGWSTYGDWDNQQSFLQFDGISFADEDIISVGMRLAIATNDSQESWVIGVRRKDDFTLPATTGDFTPGASLSGLELLGEITVPTTTGALAVTLPTSLTATSRFVLHGRQWESATAPGLNVRYVRFSGPGTTAGPRLIVHTVQPSTLRGVHDAAVQLSDGSTFYLESDGASNINIMRHIDTSGAITTIWGGGSSSGPIALNRNTVVADADDNIYTLTTGAGNLGIEYNQRTGPSSFPYQTSVYYTIAADSNQVAAVFCDAGQGYLNKGRLLVVYAKSTDGTLGFILVDIGRIQEGSTALVASGSSPSWLASSSDFRNLSGTGLSLATDVFGGTRVGVFSWSNNALTSTSGAVTYQTQMARLTVGATISSVALETGQTAFSLEGVRGKVLGIGTDTFVGVWNTATGVTLKKIGTAGTQTIAGVLGFDAVFAGGKVWVYYTDGQNLMRQPYDPSNNTLGTAEQVMNFPNPGNRNLVRLPKELREPGNVLVSYNRSQF